MKPKIRVFKGYELDSYWTEIAQKISDTMVEKYKLSYPDIDFHFANLDEMAAIVASYGWIIYPQHWSIGQQYYLNKIVQKLHGESVLEIVVNSGMKEEDKKEPIKAYINQTISDTDKKSVIAHVLGHAHVDFNNKILKKFFLKDPIPTLYSLTQKINKYEMMYGEKKVNEFITDIIHLSTLINFYPEIRLRTKDEAEFYSGREGEDEIDSYLSMELELEDVKRIKSEEEREKERKRIRELLEKKVSEMKIPPRKEYDILGFLVKYALLEEWQRDLIKDFRKLFYFEYAAGMCKTLHEGFATLIGMLYFLEAKQDELKDGEIRSWADSHARETYERNLGEGIKEGFNPYFLGYYLLLHALTKFGRGKFGIEYDYQSKWFERVIEDFNWFRDIEWDKAWKKILEIVENYNDFMLIEELFDIEFFNRTGRRYFVYEGENYPWKKKIVTSRDYEDIKRTFLFVNYNLKLPRVFIPENGGKYNSQTGEIAELYLTQDTSFPEKIGILKQQLTLKEDNMKEVMKALYRIWKKPINLETFKVKFKYKPTASWWYWYYWMWPWVGELPKQELEKAQAKIKKVVVRYDGKDFTIKEIS